MVIAEEDLPCVCRVRVDRAQKQDRQRLKEVNGFSEYVSSLNITLASLEPYGLVSSIIEFFSSLSFPPAISRSFCAKDLFPEVGPFPRSTNMNMLADQGESFEGSASLRFILMCLHATSALDNSSR